MHIIDGKEIASKMRINLQEEIKKDNLQPALAIIIVGNNKASEIYVANLKKNSAEIGIAHKLFLYDKDIDENDIINKIKELNNDSDISGIIVERPLPKKFNEDLILNYINPLKDVDGLSVSSLGLLLLNKNKYLPATVCAIIKILDSENIKIAGKNVVIVGRSKTVGKPLALALLNRNATVTITHSETKNLRNITRNADILIVAVGRSNLITGDYVKDKAVVIDVGINDINGRLIGDVNLESVRDVASKLTPVPGGVGPVTTASLLANVVKSAKYQKNIRK